MYKSHRILQIHEFCFHMYMHFIQRWVHEDSKIFGVLHSYLSHTNRYLLKKMSLSSSLIHTPLGEYTHSIEHPPVNSTPTFENTFSKQTPLTLQNVDASFGSPIMEKCHLLLSLYQ